MQSPFFEYHDWSFSGTILTAKTEFLQKLIAKFHISNSSKIFNYIDIESGRESVPIPAHSPFLLRYSFFTLLITLE